MELSKRKHKMIGFEPVSQKGLKSVMKLDKEPSGGSMKKLTLCFIFGKFTHFCYCNFQHENYHKLDKDVKTIVLNITTC